MDIRLKNSRKIRIGIIAAGLLLAVVVNMCLFPGMIREKEKRAENLLSTETAVDTEYIKNLYDGAYVLYSELTLASGKAQSENGTDAFLEAEAERTDEYDYISEWKEIFEKCRSEIDYYATDGTKEEVNTNLPLKEVLADDFDAEKDADQWNEYESLVVLNFKEDGMLSVDVKKADINMADALIKAFLQADRNNEIRVYAQDANIAFQPVKNFQVVYGVPYQTMMTAYDNYYVSDYYLITVSGGNLVYVITAFLIAAFACCMCSRKIWKSDKLPDYLPKFHDMELGIAGAAVAVILCELYIVEICQFPYTIHGITGDDIWKVPETGVVLYLIFAEIFLTTVILYPVFTEGVKNYVREHSFFYQIFPWIRKKYEQFVDEVNHIDFGKKSTKTILKIVIVNFLVLAVCACMWMFGIAVLILYSIGLFYLLKRYYDKAAKDYNVLMKAMSRIANGELDTEIKEDIGVFEPFKAELAQIQSGFKNAVNEEVKSQRMKAELITNVSHDLKTPLTAITTYVELLKKEDLTDEERKEYIATLEKKSKRLKVLIEDLFEVSKASTNNIVLNLMDVDVVNLMKQVSIEHEEKFAQKGLTLRWDVPDQKVVLKLDNQKTYRIFENLFVNIEKYAMEGSRVYISAEKIADGVVIMLRNMSAVELKVAGDELTERFVRGDASRNTEGSGLGLAIARSFTEAQNGTFHISVDGDLFKVVISWKNVVY